MAQAAWLSANPGRRSDLALHDGRDPLEPSPRLPPLSEIARYGHYSSNGARDKRMTDYPAALGGGTHNGLYSHQDGVGEQGFAQDGFGRPHFQDATPTHAYQHDDVAHQQSGYDIYPAGSSDPLGSFTSTRYRSNTSSSSSLSGGYGIGSDPMYHQPNFPDPMPSLGLSNPGNGYDLPGVVAYGNGKRSPHTPLDTPTFSGFPGSDGAMKDYPMSHIYPDQALDRRSSNVSIASSFQDDLHDDYGIPVHGHVGNSYGMTGVGANDRSLSYQSVPRIVPPQGQPSPMHPHMNADTVGGVAPLATNMFRNPSSGFDYMSGSDTDLSLPQSSMDDSLAALKLQTPGPSTDLASFMRPFLDQYVRTPNRLAFGERTIIVMSSKVAQKSYGTEKRFLCPPPTAVLVGNSWWSETHRANEDSRLCPPRVIVSISGEAPPAEGTVDWSGSTGKPFDVNDPPTGTTYIGRCVGKQLYISDTDGRQDDKRKKVEALVKVMAPASSEDDEDKVIGTFVSRPIKVISKPSKKRQSAKNLELCINHGSTVSLFHRLRSQTVSTKYLCVSGSGSSFKGSDGAPLMGLDARARNASPSFIAKTSSWDPFVLYIVDVNKAPGAESSPLAPPNPDYPSPPPNAIPFMNNGSPIPVYYNQTVVLQCLTSGVVSPILIIRKVDHQTTAVGGGAQEGAKVVNDSCCPPGETWGDPVSQLAKIAFEVYDARRVQPDLGSPGLSGAFLSCMGEKVNTYRPVEGRQWTPRYSDSPLQSPILAHSPMSASSFASMGDYFGSQGMSSMPASPDLEYPTNDGGRVRKGKRSTSSAGPVPKAGSNKAARRRPNSAGSVGGRQASNGESVSNPSSGAQWQVDIGETSVWTIVGVDQVRYNFYIPPMLYDNQNAPQSRSFPIPSKPVTPFPAVVKYLPPDRATEVPKHQFRSLKPPVDTSKMLTLYGENFNKDEPISVFFGPDPSPFVEIRCQEVVGCLPPEQQSSVRRPIILVRNDGVVFPSNTMYP